MAFDRVFELNVPAIRGADKAGTDQNQDDVGGLQLLSDFLVDAVAGQHLAIMPYLDEPGPLQGNQVIAKLIAQHLILVRIGKEKADRPRRGSARHGFVVPLRERISAGDNS